MATPKSSGVYEKPEKRRITGVPDYYQGDVERLIKLLREVELAPSNTYSDSGHNMIHKKCRRLFQDLMDTDY